MATKYITRIPKCQSVFVLCGYLCVSMWISSEIPECLCENASLSRIVVLLSSGIRCHPGALSWHVYGKNLNHYYSQIYWTVWRVSSYTNFFVLYLKFKLQINRRGGRSSSRRRSNGPHRKWFPCHLSLCWSLVDIPVSSCLSANLYLPPCNMSINVILHCHWYSYQSFT